MFARALVVGAGTMGTGIAQVCAQKGISVVLSDQSDEALRGSLNAIKLSVSKFIEKGFLSESVEEITGRIKTTLSYAEASHADIIIEAVTEKKDLKKHLFKSLDSLASDKSIIATNTSSILISDLASTVKRPENVIGLHFFNPVPLMGAVEVIRSIETSNEAFQAGADFVRHLGKEPIMVNRDIAGFIVNRINIVSNIEAMRLVEQNVSTPEDIDMAMRLSSGRKMGPFETADLVGLDVQLLAYINMYNEEKDIRFYPPSILRQKVYAGHLGRKTGRGWYKYNRDGTRIG